MGNDDTFALSQLKKRGWNDDLIDKFLGKPDWLKDNPHYRGGRPMHLYRRIRVEEAERSPEFRAAQEHREGRREAAQRAVETRRRRTVEYLKTVEIKVIRLGKEELIRRACDHYNSENRGRPSVRPDADEAFLKGICVDYLLHDLVDYERLLRTIASRGGVPNADRHAMTKLLQAIAENYDWLFEECCRHNAVLWDDDLVY